MSMAGRKNKLIKERARFLKDKKFVEVRFSCTDPIHISGRINMAE